MDVKKGITLLLLIVIGVTIVLTTIGETVDDVRDAGTSVNASNQCADAGCYYNSSQASGSECIAGADDLTLCSTGQHNPPLASLFYNPILMIFLGLAIVGIAGFMFKMKFNN